MEVLSSAEGVETREGRWLNIFDDDDPVGMKLRGLNKAYAEAVHQDVQVDAGPYGVSHTEYFNKQAVLDLIANKLAIDWLRLNDIGPQESHTKRLAEFDERLQIKR